MVLADSLVSIWEILHDLFGSDVGSWPSSLLPLAVAFYGGGGGGQGLWQEGGWFKPSN